MYRSLLRQERSPEFPARDRADDEVLRLERSPCEASDLKQAQASVQLDLPDDGAERIHMSGDHPSVAVVLPFHRRQKIALARPLDREPEGCELVLDPRKDLTAIPCDRGNADEFLGQFHNILHIGFHGCGNVLSYLPFIRTSCRAK